MGINKELVDKITFHFRLNISEDNGAYTINHKYIDEKAENLTEIGLITYLLDIVKCENEKYPCETYTEWEHGLLCM